MVLRLAESGVTTVYCMSYFIVTLVSSLYLHYTRANVMSCMHVHMLHTSCLHVGQVQLLVVNI